MIDIRPVRTDEDIAAVTGLVWAFLDFMKQRYPELRDAIEAYIRLQRVAETLADFRNVFNPPAGECMLARKDGVPVGVVMLKPAGDGACEMNRMFVAPEARRLGVGRRLCEALIAEASRLGYAEMRLGALDRHVEAIPLYRSLGFTDDPTAKRGPAGDREVLMRLALPPAAAAPP